jgi:hypothetical protein
LRVRAIRQAVHYASAIICASALAVSPLGGLLTQRALADSKSGTVVAWGDNSAGELNVPAGLSDVTAISAGPDFGLALKSDGTVVAWGDDYLGQTNVPAGLSGVIAISAGSDFSLALKRDGTVVAWGGSNTFGQTNVPAGMSGVTAISAGYASGLALESDGTVTAWGLAQIRTHPSGVVAISAGEGGLALRADGTVVDLSAPQTNVPTGLSHVTAISGTNGSLALKDDGSVVSWGYDSGGDAPAGLSDVIAIAGGEGFNLALKRDGTVVGWGDDADGQTNIPEGLSGATAIAAGGFSLALVRPGGSTGARTPFPWWIAFAAIPLALVLSCAALWLRHPNIPEAVFGRIPRWAQPTLLALLLGVLALPLVGLTCGATNGNGSWAPATSTGQWSMAAGAVVIPSLVAGTIGGALVRHKARVGAVLTFLIALLVAIPASLILPSVLGQNVDVGKICIDGCSSAISTRDLGASLSAHYAFWAAPFIEPVPVLTLAIGIGIWTATVRRLSRTQAGLPSQMDQG